MPASRKEDLIETAMRVFHAHGFHASGLDLILEEGGLSRMTLYNHFKSKDELIVAALRRRDEVFRARLEKFVNAAGLAPMQRLLAVFDYHERWFSSKDFHGCMFINATAEFSDPGSPPRQVAAEHKLAVQSYIERLCVECGIKEAERVAAQLNLLIEGATVSAHVVGQTRAGGIDPGSYARLAKAMAKRVIDQNAKG